MKNRAETISLTVLMSIIAGLLIFVPLISKAAKLGNNHEDNSGMVLELQAKINELLSATGKNKSISFVNQEEDLFLFYSTGSGPIKLKYKGTEANQDLLFERPDECEGKACICYCAAGPFWDETDKPPYLRVRHIIAGNSSVDEFKCPGMNVDKQCTTFSQDVYFGNSRGRDTQYTQGVKAEISASEQHSEVSYEPITLDIVSLLQPRKVLRKPNSDELEDYLEEKWGAYFLPVIIYKAFNVGLLNLDDYSDKHDAPFFVKPDSTIHGQYGGGSQYFPFVELLLDEYRWENGYVLGGYGSAITKRDRSKHRLHSPPVTLRFEQISDEIVGICIHNQCMFENAKKEYQDQIDVSHIEILFSKIEDGLLNHINCQNKNKNTLCLLHNEFKELASYTKHEPGILLSDAGNGVTDVTLYVNKQETEHTFKLSGDFVCKDEFVSVSTGQTNFDIGPRPFVIGNVSDNGLFILADGYPLNIAKYYAGACYLTTAQP